MALTITLQPELEAHIRNEAAREGLAVEQLAARRLQEAELLWRIRTSVPERETRELHRLLRRRKAATLTDQEQTQLLTILDEREQRSAQRLEDLVRLSHLRQTSVSDLMEQLGIRPLPTP